MHIDWTLWFLNTTQTDLQKVCHDACSLPPHLDKTFPLYTLEDKKQNKYIEIIVLERNTAKGQVLASEWVKVKPTIRNRGELEHSMERTFHVW